MKTSEMIQELQKSLAEHGDLDVRVWADHGQQALTAYQISCTFVDNEGQEYDDEDAKEYEQSDVFQNIVISG